MMRFFVLCTWLISTVVYAAVPPMIAPLSAIPGAKVPTFTCDSIQPVKCEDIATRLELYSANVAEHEQKLLDYFSDIQIAASDWYQKLQPLEGQTAVIPLDTFLEISNGTQAMSDVNTKAAVNHDCMKRELAEILKAVQSPACKK